MPRKIECAESVVKFLLDLNSINERAYGRVRKKIGQIAANVYLKGNVLVEFSFKDVIRRGKETLSFSECWFVKTGNFVIVYTFSDEDSKRVFITGVYDEDNLPEDLERYLM
jgi:mRNA-degrading endonuclease RelE of RelBE toxin-antitoxin system